MIFPPKVRVNCAAVRVNSVGVRITGEAGRINPKGIRTLCKAALGSRLSDSRVFRRKRRIINCLFPFSKLSSITQNVDIHHRIMIG